MLGFSKKRIDHNEYEVIMKKFAELNAEIEVMKTKMESADSKISSINGRMNRNAELNKQEPESIGLNPVFPFGR